MGTGKLTQDHRAVYLQLVLTLPLSGETKCECCTLTPAHPFLLKTMLGQLLWGIPPKYTSQCLLPEAQSHGKLLTTRPLSQVEDCPGLGAHTLAEGKQGPAGACCKGWRRGEVSDPPHVTGS